MELYAAIRRDARAGKSARAIEREYRVSWTTVQKALGSAWPSERKRYPNRGSKIDEYRETVDGWLRADLSAPRKQRHTAKRIFDRLREEHQADVSYARVRAYVSVRRGEILAESGRAPVEVFVPQSHRPGEEAEVDFGDVVVELRGQLVTCALFALRLSYSGRAVHRVSLSAGQEAFLEGHEHAFKVLGGVPFGRIRYDNLKSAVASVLGLSRHRVENERWLTFRSHYGIEAFYCQPGIEGAHEKGGVEGQVGWFRRNHFVPVPQVESIAELNALIDKWDADDLDRRIGARVRTVGELFTQEAPLLAPLPDTDFETGRWFHLRVDRHSQITVRTNRYSVPVRLAGRQVRVQLHASHLEVYCDRQLVATHERLPGKAETRLELDHYLEILLRKPGALPGSTALEQARAAGRFTPVHDTWWAAARRTHGDAAGTRELIGVLLAHRHLPHELVVIGLARALAAGALTADAVVLEARKAAEDNTSEQVSEDSETTSETDTVASLTVRRLAALPADPRPVPSVAAYDTLLRNPGKDTATP